MSDQITVRTGVERRERIERLVERMNERDRPSKTNPTAVINLGIDRILEELEAELDGKEKKR